MINFKLILIPILSLKKIRVDSKEFFSVGGIVSRKSSQLLEIKTQFQISIAKSKF